MYPWEQAHKYEPSVFMQDSTQLGSNAQSHISDATAHSSISAKGNDSIFLLILGLCKLTSTVQHYLLGENVNKFF